jgi:hypothetical protein
VDAISFRTARLASALVTLFTFGSEIRLSPRISKGEAKTSSAEEVFEGLVLTLSPGLLIFSLRLPGANEGVKLVNFSLSDLFVGEDSPSEQSLLLLILGVIRLSRENLLATGFLLGVGGGLGMDTVLFLFGEESQSKLERDDNLRSDDSLLDEEGLSVETDNLPVDGFLLGEEGQSVKRDNLRAYAFLSDEGVSSKTESVVFLQGVEGQSKEVSGNLRHSDSSMDGDCFKGEEERSMKIIPAMMSSLVFFFRLLDSCDLNGSSRNVFEVIVIEDRI